LFNFTCLHRSGTGRGSSKSSGYIVGWTAQGNDYVCAATALKNEKEGEGAKCQQVRRPTQAHRIDQSNSAKTEFWFDEEKKDFYFLSRSRTRALQWVLLMTHFQAKITR
jgi:hypothetical protein